MQNSLFFIFFNEMRKIIDDYGEKYNKLFPIYHYINKQKNINIIDNKYFYDIYHFFFIILNF